MVQTPPQRLYESPPNSGSNDGALPIVYDPNWQRFTNLTPEQIVAFQSFPADLLRYSATRRYLAEISGITIGGIPLNTQERDQQKIAALKQAFDTGALLAGSNVQFFDAAGNVQSVSAATATNIYRAVVVFVQQLYSAAATVVTGINAVSPTVTTRKQIDAVYAAIAPNSPSATNPSST